MTAHSLVESVGPYGFAVAKLACNGQYDKATVLRLAQFFEEEPDETGWLFVRLAEGVSKRSVGKEFRMNQQTISEIIDKRFICLVSLLDPCAVLS